MTKFFYPTWNIRAYTFLIIQFLYRLLNKKKLTCISNEYAEPIVFSDDIDILEIE